MKISVIAISLLLLSACIHTEHKEKPVPEDQKVSQLENTKAFKEALRQHLDAVSAKDIDAVKKTLPPSNESMHLILPNGTQMNTAGEFIKMHDDWFKDTSTAWTLNFSIKYAYANGNLGYALVEGMLEEPNRNGKPYFHKMHVSYVLEKINGKWLVIKDHASTIEKSE